jgi:hypothetical protein
MSSRAGIHYWKCDRPAALFGTRRAEAERAGTDVMQALLEVLPGALPGCDVAGLMPAGGQGNHLTFRLPGPRPLFVRVEDGPERDDYLIVESALLEALGRAGIPVPGVHAVDGARTRVPFAWHVLDDVGVPDLNTHFKAGTLEAGSVFGQLGTWIARWQSCVPVSGFGPFDIARWRAGAGFVGLCGSAADFFFLRLAEHLDFLVERGLIDRAFGDHALVLARRRHGELASLPPVLVHKDMALWNVLGTPDRVVAFIDWDDAIGGDPLEDIALLGCFHDAAAIESALSGYAAERVLPGDWAMRFWLHLLRNIVIKAVIRIGAGYFDDRGGAFLLGPGGGAALRRFTLERLNRAVEALEARQESIGF